MISSEKARDLVLLTGLPVSDKMQSILERCKRGEYVDVKDIRNTPEMKVAESCVSHATPTINLKNREDIVNHIFEKMMNYGSVSLDEKGNPIVDSNGNTIYNDNVKIGKRLDIVIGLPASGKSSAIVDKISHEYYSMLIDNDEAKRMFPEFNKGWGSTVVHEESQIVEQIVFREAVSQGRNIVLPKVGSDANKLMDSYIKFAKMEGYVVNVHYVELDRNKALGRMIERFIHTGRYLEPKLIDKYVNERDGNRILQSYEVLKQQDEVDGYSWWDNDVAINESPILLEVVNVDGDFVKNARMKEDIGDEKFISKQSIRGSKADLCISRSSGRNRETNEPSIERDYGQNGRNEGYDASRKDSVSNGDLRQVYASRELENAKAEGYYQAVISMMKKTSKSAKYSCGILGVNYEKFIEYVKANKVILPKKAKSKSKAR